MDKLIEHMNRALTDLGEREPKNLFQLQAKLTEEHGELAAAMLHHEGLKEMTVADAREHVLEEACDVIIMCLSILSRYQVSLEEVEQMTGQKLAKWEVQIDKRLAE